MIVKIANKASRKVPVLAFSVACLFASMGTQAGEKVKPPPLTPGFSMVRIQVGMNDDEVSREKRAHHHKGHHRKNVDKDDSDKGGKDNKDDNQPGNN